LIFERLGQSLRVEALANNADDHMTIHTDIIVMVDRNAGIIVPRRSFASDAEREQFVSEVQGRARELTT